VDDPTLELLRTGEVEVLGLLPYSSNYTFLARVTAPGTEAMAVYKPQRGERPLWDFPHGSLAAREVAAWIVAEAAGWHFVPPTVMRQEAPLGAGSFQLFVDHDPERHYFVLMEERAEELRTFALFDAVINNADRKSGHVLEDRAGKLWAVDHGVSFHTEPKLRTVIWAYADEPLDPGLRRDLELLGTELSDGSLSEGLSELLAEEEVVGTLARIESLLVEDRFPAPSSDRPLPWPLI
jgi:uncharacterized repeat protein (TIGR03843 family)